MYRRLVHWLQICFRVQYQNIYGLITEPELQSGHELQALVLGPIDRRVGLHKQVDIATTGIVVESRTKHADHRVRTENLPHRTADDILRLLR